MDWLSGVIFMLILSVIFLGAGYIIFGIFVRVMNSLSDRWERKHRNETILHNVEARFHGGN